MDEDRLDNRIDDPSNSIMIGNIYHVSPFDSSSDYLESVSGDDSDIANSGDGPLWAKAVRVVTFGLIGLCLASSILMVIFPERQTQPTYSSAENAKSDEMKAKMDKFWKDDAKAWAASQAKAEAAGQKILAK